MRILMGACILMVVLSCKSDPKNSTDLQEANKLHIESIEVYNNVIKQMTKIQDYNLKRDVLTNRIGDDSQGLQELQHLGSRSVHLAHDLKRWQEKLKKYPAMKIIMKNTVTLNPPPPLLQKPSASKKN